ncbi:Uncharacterized protein FKW44_016613, partial [Caligus rogercresseyi]
IIHSRGSEPPLGGISTSSSTLPSSSSSSSSSHLKPRPIRNAVPDLLLHPSLLDLQPGRHCPAALKKRSPTCPPRDDFPSMSSKRDVLRDIQDGWSPPLPPFPAPFPLLDKQSPESSLSILPNPGILAECRNTGTCYFCKKSFMKNKQLMNHVCPVKPKILLQKKTSSSSLR